MLQLIPRTAASKKKKSFKPNVTAGSSQNRGSPLVCLALLPLPQSENLTPNSTIEYANYLHIKNTPRKTKSMAQMLYKDTGQGSGGSTLTESGAGGNGMEGFQRGNQERG